jgi:hypothetical protein
MQLQPFARIPWRSHNDGIAVLAHPGLIRILKPLGLLCHCGVFVRPGQ